MPCQSAAGQGIGEFRSVEISFVPQYNMTSFLGFQGGWKCIDTVSAAIH